MNMQNEFVRIKEMIIKCNGTEGSIHDIGIHIDEFRNMYSGEKFFTSLHSILLNAHADLYVSSKMVLC